MSVAGMYRASLSARTAQLLGVAAVSFLGSCAGPSLQEQIRERIAQAERAVERKELSTLEDFVSDAYADEHGRDKRTVVQLVTQHLHRQGSVHLLSMITEIRLIASDSAEVDLLVAVAATPLEGFDDLSRFRAELYRSDLTFQRDHGAWRLTAANWRTAALREFL